MAALSISSASRRCRLLQTLASRPAPHEPSTATTWCAGRRTGSPIGRSPTSPRKTWSNSPSCSEAAKPNRKRSRRRPVTGSQGEDQRRAKGSGSPMVRLVSSGDRGRADVSDANARFASVVMPHIDEAYRLAQWLTSNRADAEDVVQDALLRAFRGIGGFAGSNARAWVLSIVRNTAYSWMRQNRPSTVITVEDLEAVELVQTNPGDPNVETPEAALIANADAEQLRAAIA